MKTYKDTDVIAETAHGAVVTIGNFDGVHRGHRALIQAARTLADQDHLPLVAVTFEPHPRMVLFPEKILKRLTDKEEKARRLEAAGVDVLYLVTFSRDYAQTEPEDFITGTLVHALHARHVVVGESFSFGRGGRGDVELLRRDGARHDFAVHVQPPVLDETGEIISSSRIRRLLAEGNHQAAKILLEG